MGGAPEHVSRVAQRTDDLSERSFRALKWNYLGNATRAISQLLIGIILARLLGPEAFGILAIAWFMIGLGVLVADLGFGAAIVQRPELMLQDLRFLFTLQVGVGVLLSSAGILLAPIVAGYFHRPDATPVIQCMALLFIAQSFGQTALAVLRHGLDFRAAQSIGIVSYLVAYVLVGLPCAYLGYGAWSLVAAQLLQSTLSSLLAIRRSGVPIRPAFKPASRGLVSFGTKVIGANLSSWTISNLDSWMVGRVLGVVDLGLYSRAMTLVATPMNAVTASIQGVLLAACSRAQEDAARLKRAYLAATMVVAAICLPVFLTTAAVPDAVIAGLLGPAWLPAVSVLAPLALAMPVNALLALVGPVLTAMDRVDVELRVQAITVAVMLPALYVTANHSIAAVAWGVLCVYSLRLVLLMGSLLHLFDGRWTEPLNTIAWPALFAVLTAVMTWAVDHLARDVRPFPRLLLDVGAAALSVTVIARLLGRRPLCAPYGTFLLAEGRLPAPVRRWLRV